MSELERWAQRPAPLMSSREEREGKRAAVAIVTAARVAAVEGEASAALIAKSMEQTVDLFKHGQSLAGDNPALAAEMNGYVAAFIDGAKHRQRAFDSGFKL